MEHDLKTLVDLALGWSKDRQILAHSTPAAQLLKGISELGELADAVGKCDEDAAADAVGDVLVCLINVAALLSAKNKDAPGPADVVTLALMRCERPVIHVPPAIAVLVAADRIGSTSDMIARGLSVFSALSSVRMSVIGVAGVAHALGLDPVACLALAWDQIKDRRGYLSAEGVFVKEVTPA